MPSMYRTNKRIIAKTSFRGLHNWPEASTMAGAQVDFLENPHRHTFFVQAELNVLDSDREVEFFVFQNQVDQVIQDLYPQVDLLRNLGRRSCETIAEEIINALRDKFKHKGSLAIEVWEDNEVGARIESNVL